MSLSKKHKNYVSNGGQLSFAEWVVKYDNMAQARAARGTKKRRTVKAPGTPVVQKPLKARIVKAATPKYTRVENRVDCFGLNRKGILIVGADASDGKLVAQICRGKVVSTYTSGRGERARIETKHMKHTVANKLAAAGFTPKGF